MPIIVSEGGRREYDLVDQGVHVAICTTLVDLGTHTSEFQGKEVTRRRVLIGWEIPGHRRKITIDDEEIDAPSRMSKEFSLTLDERGNLRPFLESWRGRAFTSTELAAFDLEAVVYKGCQLQVVHRVSTQGRTFANVDNVMPLPQGAETPDAEQDVLVFSIAGWDGGTGLPLNMPKWVQEKVMESEEWKRANKKIENELDSLFTDEGSNQPVSANTSHLDSAESVGAQAHPRSNGAQGYDSTLPEIPRNKDGSVDINEAAVVGRQITWESERRKWLIKARAELTDTRYKMLVKML